MLVAGAAAISALEAFLFTSQDAVVPTRSSERWQKGPGRAAVAFCPHPAPRSHHTHTHWLRPAEAAYTDRNA